MDIINCPRCGKLFSKMSEPICEECLKEEEDLFQKVRIYIDEHPNCTVNEVTKETGASVKKIMKYLREGRLEISKGMSGTLRCEKCNKPITRGHYCDTCVIQLNQEVVNIYSQDVDTNKARMHTASTRRINNP